MTIYYLSFEEDDMSSAIRHDSAQVYTDWTGNALFILTVTKTMSDTIASLCFNMFCSIAVF